MLQLWKEGSFGRKLKKCSHCGKKGHVAKDCWEKHPDRKPKAKGKAQPSKPVERTRSPRDVELARAKVEGNLKDVERGTSFVELMEKKKKMIRIMMTMRKRTRVMITQSLKLIPVVVAR